MKHQMVNFLGLETYSYLDKNLRQTDISKNLEYQTRFNGFYRVRRDEKWRKIYYEYFEKNKNDKELKFEEIIKYLFEKTGNIEPSFSSKMLSTINPDMPILDSRVLKNLGLELKYNLPDEEKIQNAVEAYYKIVELEQAKLKEPETQKFIQDFCEFFPEYNLSDIRILDLLLWGE